MADHKTSSDESLRLPMQYDRKRTRKPKGNQRVHNRLPEGSQSGVCDHDIEIVLYSKIEETTQDDMEMEQSTEPGHSRPRHPRKMPDPTCCVAECSPACSSPIPSNPPILIPYLNEMQNVLSGQQGNSKLRKILRDDFQWMAGTEYRRADMNKSFVLEGQDEKLYFCPVCKRQEGTEPMVACSRCSDWYHFRCIKILDYPENLNWWCKRCVYREILVEKYDKAHFPELVKQIRTNK